MNPPANPSPGENLEREALELIDALLEQQISREQMSRLDQLVRENPGICRLYILSVHLRYGIPVHLGPPLSILDDEAFPNLFRDNPLTEAMVMPALSADDLPSLEPEIVDLPRFPLPPSKSKRPFLHLSGRALLGLAASLAIVIGALSILMRGTSPPPIEHAVDHAVDHPVAPVIVPPVTDHALPPAIEHAARLTGVAGAEWEMQEAGRPMVPGAVLNQHEVIRLKSGAAEVTFDDGATVVLEGPAVLILTDAGHAQLEEGKLAARVPPPAHGFTIVAHGATVTDLGTEFGLSVNKTGDAAVEVFKGDVTVAAAGAEKPLALTADHGARISAAGVVEQVPRVGQEFVRDISQYRRPIPLHNTGVNLKPGDGDTFWQLVSQSANPAYQAAPAIVADVQQEKTYPPNDPARSQWLSIGADLPEAPVGTYVFRGTIDFSGFDPSSAVIHVKVAADDAVTAVRINGKPVPLTVDFSQGNRRNRPFVSFDLPAPAQGFLGGANQIEFVVLNGPSPHNNYNPMALRVEWEGSALVLATR